MCMPQTANTEVPLVISAKLTVPIKEYATTIRAHASALTDNSDLIVEKSNQLLSMKFGMSFNFICDCLLFHELDNILTNRYPISRITVSTVSRYPLGQFLLIVKL